MARFPIQEGRQELGFTPSTGVRAGFDLTTGDTGAAIGQALVAGAELWKRKQKMDDALAQNDAKNIMRLAELEIAKFRESEPDTRLWTKQAEGVFSQTAGRVGAIKASKQATNIIGSQLQMWTSEQRSLAQIGEIKQKKIDTQAVLVDELTNAYRYQNPADIAAAESNFDVTIKTIVDSDEAAALRRNAISAGLRAHFADRATVNAEDTIATLNKELTLRKRGEGKIPEDVMSNPDIIKSIDYAQDIAKSSLVEFENNLNNELVEIDNTPNMSQVNFDTQASLLKNKILTANIPGTRKKKLLSDLEKWRRGTNEIDYAKILSLNQEMDAAQRSGIVDPTIKDRIVRASVEGAFGGRNKGGQKTYGDLIRRFEKLQFDERLQAVSFLVKQFERENAAIDPRIVFLFHQAKNKLIADNPDMSTKELFMEVSALIEAYEIMPEGTIEKTMKTIPMTSPDGKRYMVPIEKRQKFLDNGYTE